MSTAINLLMFCDSSGTVGVTFTFTLFALMLKINNPNTKYLGNTDDVTKTILKVKLEL